MENEWRPAEWEGQPDFCGRCKDHPKSCYICVAGYESGASAMLAARDKWWIEGVEKVFGRTKAYFCMNPDFPKCEFCTEFYMKPCVYFEWQSLKQSLEAKQ
jgi:hypothetical protein